MILNEGYSDVGATTQRCAISSLLQEHLRPRFLSPERQNARFAQQGRTRVPSEFWVLFISVVLG